jgi:ribosome-interacting GTPase 1
VVKDLIRPKFPIHVISAEHGQGLEDFRNAVYKFLNVIRVYTKKPGKPPDMNSPFSLPVGGTVLDLATLVHRDLATQLKSAKAWGTGVFDGQAVPRDHVLHDRDVVELHT